jgi:replicative superfamily II helicase
MTAPRTSLVDEQALEDLEKSSFVSAIPAPERRRIADLATARRAARALGSAFSFHLPVDWSEDAEDAIRRLTLAYEVTAGANLDVLLLSSGNKEIERQVRAAMFRAYEMRVAWKIPEDDYERALHILSTAAYGYLGDRWQDARRLLRENEEAARPLKLSEDWESRLLSRLFDAWISLVRKRDITDLSRVGQIVAMLRQEQSRFEPTALDQDDARARGTRALRLLALYHWAKATEIMGAFMLQGEGGDVVTDLDMHFTQAHKAAVLTRDAALDVVLHHLHICAVLMARGSIWQLRGVAGIPRDYVKTMPVRGMFEMLPPQRAAIFDANLLDPALHAVVVELPTSGGKTQLAELRMMQVVESMRGDVGASRGWIAYIAPTRALVDQITRRLRQTFEPMRVRVDRLSGAIDIDPFEVALFADAERPPDIVVCTPEKLTMVLRGQELSRPLRLVVVDEAHNIEDPERGIGLELLLAEIRAEHPECRFLLLMPHVPEAERLERWLARDGKGRTISLSTTAWQPNERVVGLITGQTDGNKRGRWELVFNSLVTPRRTIGLAGPSVVRGAHQISGPASQIIDNKTKLAAAMAVATVERGTAIVLTTTVPLARNAARAVYEALPDETPTPEIARVQRFLQTELGHSTEIVELLNRRIGLHHSQLSDEARVLMEQLAENGAIKILAATMTLAQGLNFPVSAVYLQDYKFFDQKSSRQVEMTPLAFWNLAGRAGRLQQGQLGIVGLACKEGSVEDTKQFVARQLGTLLSSFERIIQNLRTTGRKLSLEEVKRNREWSDFRLFVAHLVNQKKALDRVDETERLLRNTLAFQSLQSDAVRDPRARQVADDLIARTRDYALHLRRDIAEASSLADATGFDPESIRPAIARLGEAGLKNLDWSPGSLFREGDVARLATVIGIAMKLPQFEGLTEYAGSGMTHERLAHLASAWVNGASLEKLSNEFFSDEGEKALDTLCKAVYKTLATYGTWSLAGLGTLSAAGRELSEEQRRQLNLVPAFLYYGVNSEAAVALRMHGVPRGVTPILAKQFVQSTSDADFRRRPHVARDFLESLNAADWQRAVPERGPATGEDYRAVWRQLSGFGPVE